jgi:hypothetical protein
MWLGAVRQIRILGAPSVWSGGNTLFFRAAKNNHLCAIAFDPASASYSLTDYSTEVRESQGQGGS